MKQTSREGGRPYSNMRAYLLQVNWSLWDFSVWWPR